MRQYSTATIQRNAPPAIPPYRVLDALRIIADASEPEGAMGGNVMKRPPLYGRKPHTVNTDLR